MTEASRHYPKRRDFLFVATGAVGAVGAAGAIWPIIDQMNPDASVLALVTFEFDVSAVEEGQTVTIKWRGLPVFVRQWLIMIANCTHLGCVPVGEAGDYGGWFCPCHGSQFDVSGRVRAGPAPTNLVVMPYEWLSKTLVRIG